MQNVARCFVTFVKQQQRNLSTQRHRVVSVVQLGLAAACTASKAFPRVKQIIFSVFFSIFESGSCLVKKVKNIRGLKVYF